MATRKNVKKKLKSTNGCLPTTIILIILVILSLAATFYFLFLRPWPGLVPPMTTNTRGKTFSSPAKAAPSRPAPPPTAATAPPTAEAPTNIDQPAPTTVNTTPNTRIAIIIDDIGNTKEVAEQIIALDLPLSFSIIPHTPYAAHLAGLANARNRDLLIHIPMEASESKISIGPGMLLLSMTHDSLITTIHDDLNTPFRAIGVNNHMGSKFTENPDAMRIFLQEVKARNLFFIDSLTTSSSTGFAIARELGIKTAKRDIFLDNDHTPREILAQIEQLIQLAKRHGSAIGIGHPHPATLAALRSAQTRLSQDVVIVPVHELVN